MNKRQALLIGLAAVTTPFGRYASAQPKKGQGTEAALRDTIVQFENGTDTTWVPAWR